MPFDPRIQVDPDVVEALAHRNVYVGNDGYARFSPGGKKPALLHVFVMGKAPDGMVIDHINGDRLDNRRSNLRCVTDQVNQINRKSLNANNRSGFRGVSYIDRKSARGKPWRASITVDGKHIHLGVFATAEEAARSRRAAEEEHFPELCPEPLPGTRPNLGRRAA